jgi:hypothetical protein
VSPAQGLLSMVSLKEVSLQLADLHWRQVRKDVKFVKFVDGFFDFVNWMLNDETSHNESIK